MLIESSQAVGMKMQELLGQTFRVGEETYRIVDVRQLSGERMVYAESLAESEDGKPRRPRRAAFHYGDIATRLGDARVQA